MRRGHCRLGMEDILFRFICFCLSSNLPNMDNPILNVSGFYQTKRVEIAQVKDKIIYQTLLRNSWSMPLDKQISNIANVTLADGNFTVSGKGKSHKNKLI